MTRYPIETSAMTEVYFRLSSLRRNERGITMSL
jgi:hypothetical protein